MLDILLGKKKSDYGYNPIDRTVFRNYNRYRPGGAKELFCYVPFNSMTFSFRGQVFACTYNRDILIGEYPTNSLNEIWFGEKLKKLQDHMAHNDLNYGCQYCKYFVDKGKYTGLKPQVFDKYADNKKGHYPRVLEFELSNRCNLECIMCSGEVSSSIRQNRDNLPPIRIPYDDSFVEQLREFIPHLKEAKFFGGEPFLINIYYQIWDLIMELNPNINIFVITNGTTLTNKIKELLKKGDFDLAISIDSIRKERYEYIRKNASFDTVMENLDYFNAYCKSRNRKMTLSFTTQRENWEELPEVIQFCNSKDMMLFNSYVKTPVNIALWSLPADRLKEIYQYLVKFDLPDRTPIEKYNKLCYQDYLNYILQYEKKNRFEEENGTKKVTENAEEEPEYLSKFYANRQEFYTDIRKDNNWYDFKRKALTNKVIETLEFSFSKLNDEDAERRILADVANASLPQIMSYVDQRTAEELYKELNARYKAEA